MTGFDSYHNSFFVREQGGLQLKVSVVSSAYILGLENRLQAGRSVM